MSEAREVLAGAPELREIRMFGGLAFMVREHMTCGVLGADLLVRLGAEGAGEALGEPGVREFDFTGRPMSSVVVVGAGAIAGDADLERWIARARAFVDTLPPKEPGGSRPRRRM